MYYIWYFNNDDPNTFQFLTKGTNIMKLWIEMKTIWDTYTDWISYADISNTFELSKAYKEITYGYCASISPYSFLIEYIGD